VRLTFFVVPAEKLEKAWIGNFAGELFCNQGHLGAAVVGALPALKYKPVTRVEAACASGALAFSHAVEAIQVRNFDRSDVCMEDWNGQRTR
jgi:acetyl-CoA acetyltransferase